MSGTERRPSGLGELVSELRRRHVVRVAVGYLAGVFVVLQIAEIVLPAFDVPELGLRALVVLTALGFPVAVVLAWVYEITPQGIRRTADLDAGAGRTPTVGRLVPRLALLAITVVTVGVVGWWQVRAALAPMESPTPVEASPVASADDVPIRSLAVLPLANYSEVSGQDYFVAGMHEALIANLSRLESVRVVSRTSVMQYAGTSTPIPRIGRELGVEGIVEGSVLRAEDRVRITVQLIHAPSDRHVWSKSYDREFKDVIALQAEVAEDIAREIQNELSAEERRVFAVRAGVAVPEEAQEAYLRGRYEATRGTPEGLRSAVEYYERAVEVDSAFAPAYAALAGTRLLLAVGGDEPDGNMIPGVESAALKALELDPASPEAHEVLAVLKTRLAPGLAGAQELALEPFGPSFDSIPFDSAFVSQQWMATVSELGQRIHDAVKAKETRAASAPAQMVAAARHMEAMGEHAEAVTLLDQALELAPQLPTAWDAMEHIHASRGEWDKVLDLRRRRVEATGSTPEARAELSALEREIRRDGAEGYWRWRLTYLQEMVTRGEKVSSVELAAAHTAMGQFDEALARLGDAFREGDRRLPTIATDPTFDPLRSEPRFKELVRRIRWGFRGVALPPGPPEVRR